jgi:hypothetical protein
LTAGRTRQTLASMRGLSAAHLLRLPVRVHGIELGRPVDLVLDRAHTRVLGFEVLCGDEERRFLPLAVVTVRETQLELRSSLGLLDDAVLAFYTKRGSTFAALRGCGVVRARAMLGELADLKLAADGTIASVVVATPNGPKELDYGADVALVPAGTNVRAAS